MATKIYEDYTLEQLTVDSVNVLTVSSAKVNGKMYELERSRICYANSPIGRQQIVEALPEQYAEAVLAVWGDTPTLSDPEKAGGAE
jgi:hypothetical protein